MKAVDNNFEHNIMNLRKKFGLTQEELAEICNVSRQTISKWETGLVKPDMEKCILMADYFDISLDELIKKKINTKNEVVYSFEKICESIFLTPSGIEDLYNNPKLYDTWYTDEVDDAVEIYWREILSGIEIKSILDCSIGTGQMTLALANMGYSLYGSDLNNKMLEQCSANSSKKEIAIDLRQMDFRNLEGWNEKKFDLVVSTGNALPHVNKVDVGVALREMNKLVNRGGYLYLDIRNWDKILKTHQRLFFYQPRFKNGNRINLMQVWDYNLDGTITFNIIFLYEKNNIIYEKKVGKVIYYPISINVVKEYLQKMNYTIIKEGYKNIGNNSKESDDWIYILAKKQL